MTLTQERLKELLHYDPETGVFTWFVRRLRGNVPNSSGYLTIKVDAKTYQAHRVAWLYAYGKFPANQIDHINHNRTDNRLVNLRCVTHRENTLNQKRPRSNTSGILGVHFAKDRGKWRAQIKIARHNIMLGTFKTKEEAIAARQAANIKYGFHDNHGQ